MSSSQTTDPVSKLVLVVDDDEVICEVLSSLLEHLGYQVLLTQSADEALKIWDEKSESISYVFTDVMMPGIDGLSLARMLRKKTPQIPILLLSGHLNDDSRWIVSEEGFCFLQKPFSLEELQRAMSILAEPAT